MCLKNIIEIFQYKKVIFVEKSTVQKVYKYT